MSPLRSGNQLVSVGRSHLIWGQSVFSHGPWDAQDVVYFSARSRMAVDENYADCGGTGADAAGLVWYEFGHSRSESRFFLARHPHV